MPHVLPEIDHLLRALIAVTEEWWLETHHAILFTSSVSPPISASLALPPSSSIVREERMNARPLVQMNSFKVYNKGFI